MIMFSLQATYIYYKSEIAVKEVALVNQVDFLASEASDLIGICSLTYNS